ncbi:MAG TPA: hypothetical protein VJT32_16475 [bacterium]|nr:hypothetical protein [bacterium]
MARDGRKWLINVTVIGLKVLALAAVLQPLFTHHATRIVTVFMPSAPGSVYSPQHRPAYSYFSDLGYLNYNNLKWSLIAAVAIYVAALLIEAAASRILAPARGAGGSQPV